MKDNFVTVLCTVYNGETYCERMIKSILYQTYPKFELLIINDGSTDETLNIISNWQKEDNRIRIINLKRVGRANALNVGLKNAKYELIAIQDVDDISFPERIEKQVEYTINNSDISWWGASYIFDNQKRNERYKVKVPALHEDIVKHLIHSIPWAHTLVMFKKSKVLKVGGYPVEKMMLDVELSIKLVRSGEKLGNVQTCLGVHYAYENSYFDRSFSKFSRMLRLAILNIKVIEYLKVSKWYYIYPFGRLIYPFIPNFIKKIIRRKIIGVKEQNI